MSTLEGARVLLEEAGLGVFGRDLFLSTLPGTPDAATVVRTYPGTPPGYYHNAPAPAYESPRLQVVCRDTTYPAAETRCQLAMLTLGAVHNRDMGGVLWLSVMPLASPVELVLDDEQRRRTVVCNFQVLKGVG